MSEFHELKKVLQTEKRHICDGVDVTDCPHHRADKKCDKTNKYCSLKHSCDYKKFVDIKTIKLSNTKLVKQLKIARYNIKQLQSKINAMNKLNTFIMKLVERITNNVKSAPKNEPILCKLNLHDFVEGRNYKVCKNCGKVIATFNLKDII